MTIRPGLAGGPGGLCAAPWTWSHGLTAAQFVGIFRGRAGQTLAPHPASGQLVPDHLAQFALLGRFWGLASLHSESMFGRATARLRHRGSHVNMTTDSRTYQLSRQGEPRGAKGIPDLSGTEAKGASTRSVTHRLGLHLGSLSALGAHSGGGV